MIFSLPYKLTLKSRLKKRWPPCLVTVSLAGFLSTICYLLFSSNNISQWIIYEIPETDTSPCTDWTSQTFHLSGLSCDNCCRIPRILHQTFKTDEVPVVYRPFVDSWMKHHPNWDYYFWTDDDAMAMIRERYPQYTRLMERYEHPLMRSDAIRYFVLHQFGGVYADLDMLSLRPIEQLFRSNSCMLTPEPEMLTQFLFNHQMSLTNCIMASSPNHPFMTELIAGLDNAYRARPFKDNPDLIYITGPFLLNATHQDYVRRHPHCLPGTYCHVNVVPGHLMVPSADWDRMKIAKEEQCTDKLFQKSMTKFQSKVCDELSRMDLNNTVVPKEAFTDHKWLHLGWFHGTDCKAQKNCMNISDIVPKAIRYSRR